MLVEKPLEVTPVRAPGTFLFTLHPPLLPLLSLFTCSSLCVLRALSVVGLVLPVPETKAPLANKLRGGQS